MKFSKKHGAVWTMLVLLVAVLAASGSLVLAQTSAAAQRSPTPRSITSPFKVETVTSGLENPWGLVFLPDGRMLVTERPGRMRIVERAGKLSAPLHGVPAVFARGQGGLLDVALDPQFTATQLVYWSYAEPGTGGGVAGTAVARGRLQGNTLENVTVIWRQTPKVDSALHWGSRLVFDRQGRLFITTGERSSYRERAQDLSATLGKVIRINADGSIPADNPFVARKDVKPEIWSYGHRNIQAAALHPDSGALWTLEHGARGGDELNQPQAGKNYGWPVITYGVNYNGFKIGEGTARAGMEQPVYYWDPVIAPSGAVFYTGGVFKEWRGDLFIGSLTPGLLVRLHLDNGRVVSETRYLDELEERIRNVRQGPDGLLYLLTDNSSGRILKLSPK
jgi:aldose sugar dehydrogenase